MELVLDDADPTRCQFVDHKFGQCKYVSTEHSDYCIRHGGGMVEDRVKTETTNRYKSELYQTKLDNHNNHANQKSLKDEISLLRLFIEERFSSITNYSQLAVETGPISELIMKVDKVVNSMHKLEKSMGEHLSKTQLTTFAETIIKIISDVLDDQKSVVDTIVSRIQEEFKNGL